VTTPDQRPSVLRFTSFGVTAELRCADDDVLRQAREALPPRWTVADPSASVEAWFEISRSDIGPRRPFTLRVDGVPTASALRAAPVIDELEVAVRNTVALRAPEMLFVHAGVVAVGDVAVVMPGRSGSGKTTLVDALLRAGATYGSDDYAVIDRDGRVHAYPRRLSIRQGPDRRLRRSADAIAGAGEFAGALPLGLVVVTEFQPITGWSPKRLSPGESAMALFAHTLAARDRPDTALQHLGKATIRATTLAGPRGDAADCALHIVAAARALSLSPPEPTP
jgi:hypothetical protein